MIYNNKKSSFHIPYLQVRTKHDFFTSMDHFQQTMAKLSAHDKEFISKRKKESVFFTTFLCQSFSAHAFVPINKSILLCQCKYKCLSHILPCD